MEPREAAELLTLMRGSWPRLAPDEVANQLWLDDLVVLDQRAAIEAFRSLRDTEAHAPSWALFRETYFAQSRRFERSTPALPAWEPDPPDEEQKRLVSELVGTLKDLVELRKEDLEPWRGEINVKHSDFDPLTPMLTYEEVYSEEPAGDEQERK